jgi:hypothetical protein
MTDAVILQQRLTEAETALHKLLTASKVEEIRHGQNEHMRFAKADIPALRLYINDLRSQLGLDPVSPPRGRARRPVYSR